MTCGCLVSRNRHLFAHKTVRQNHETTLPAVSLCGHWRRKKLRRKIESNLWNASSAAVNENNQFDSDILRSIPQQLSYVEQSYIHFHSTPSYNEFLIDGSAHADAPTRDSLILSNMAKVGVSRGVADPRDAATEYTLQHITPIEFQGSFENPMETRGPRNQRAGKLEPNVSSEVMTTHRHKSEFYRDHSKLTDEASKATKLIPASSIGQNITFSQEMGTSGVGVGVGNSYAVTSDSVHTFHNKAAVGSASDNLQFELGLKPDDKLRYSNRQRNVNEVALGPEVNLLYANDTTAQIMTPNLTNCQSTHSPLHERSPSHPKNAISLPSTTTGATSTAALPHRADAQSSDLYCRVRNVYVLPEFSYCLSAPDQRLE
ncbi:hypothetical protein SprV_0602231800 [Sparganum proliferum]